MAQPRMNPQAPGEERVDFRDPLHVAVELTQLRARQDMQAQETTTGLRNVFEQLASLQGDMREVERLAQGISNQQHQFQEHSSGIERLAKVIERHVEQQERKWESHERDNQQVADRVTMWRGVVIGLMLVAGLALSAAIYIVQSGFADAAQERVRIDARLDRLEARP
jgi:anti-sigma-K factor RskA